MADEAGPPLVSFSGGMFSGRVESTMRESAQATYYNLLSVDAGPLGAGATVTGSQTTQLNGYQIQASNTWFSTVAAGGACILPQTNRPFPFAGLEVFIANTGANNLICFPHPSDAGNSINGQASNASVVIGPNTITPFQCFTPGIWFADSIGTGFAGSLETVVSQGNVATAGTNQGTATPITQTMVNFTSGTGNGSAGGTLPAAKAGLQIAVGVNITATQTISVYPAGTDTINTVGGGAAFTTAAAPNITIFMCFVNGAWFTK
jgi:hypothetical protein